MKKLENEIVEMLGTVTMTRLATAARLACRYEATRKSSLAEVPSRPVCSSAGIGIRQVTSL